jgi:hypothetical protein
MNQARFQMIIWREAPKKDFLHNLGARYIAHQSFIFGKLHIINEKYRPICIKNFLFFIGWRTLHSCCPLVAKKFLGVKCRFFV